MTTKLKSKLVTPVAPFYEVTVGSRWRGSGGTFLVVAMPVGRQRLKQLYCLLNEGTSTIDAFNLSLSEIASALFRRDVVGIPRRKRTVGPPGKYATVAKANAAGVRSGTLRNGDTFGDEDDALMGRPPFVRPIVKRRKPLTGPTARKRNRFGPD